MNNTFYIASRLSKICHTQDELKRINSFFLGIEKNLTAQINFFEYCKKWKLAPWIFVQLQKLDLLPYLDITIQVMFKEMHERITIENTARFNEATNFLKEFQTSGIDVVVLKGNAFITEVYNNIGYKKMNDFDMLIHIEDWFKVRKIYQKLHYIPLGFGWGGEKEKVAKFSHTGLSFISPNYACITGTQWGLKSPTSKYSITIEDVWDTTQPLLFNNTLHLKKLSAEYNLLHLVLHMGTYKCGIRDCMDVYNLLLSQNEFNEDLFVEICKKTKATEKAYFTLVLSQLCCGSISKSLIEKLKPGKHNFIIRRLHSRLAMFNRTGDMQLSYNDYFHEVEMIVFYFSLYPTFHKKVVLYAKLIKAMFFPNNQAALKLADVPNDPTFFQKCKARIKAPYFIFSLIGEEIGVGITCLLFVKMFLDTVFSLKNYIGTHLSYFQFLKKEGVNPKEIVSVVKGIQ